MKGNNEKASEVKISSKLMLQHVHMKPLKENVIKINFIRSQLQEPP